MSSVIAALIETLQEHLRTFAKQTSQSVEEVMQVAGDIGLGMSIGGQTNFVRLEVQEGFLKKVKNALFGEIRQRRRFASLDRPIGNDADAGSLLDFIAALPGSDPIEIMLERESEGSDTGWLRASFSEFTAYAYFILNSRSVQGVADYFALTMETLTNRVTRSLDRKKRQPSLFDGIAHIDRNFLPLRGIPKPPRGQEGASPSRQLAISL